MASIHSSSLFTVIRCLKPHEIKKTLSHHRSSELERAQKPPATYVLSHIDLLSDNRIKKVGVPYTEMLTQEPYHLLRVTISLEAHSRNSLDQCITLFRKHFMPLL